MSALTSRMTRLTAAAVAGAWISTAAGGQAFAADAGGVDVVNTETVQVYLNASGKIDSKRVYEQIDLTGHGKVDLRNPVETKGLRNLDGFSGFDVVDHEQVVKTSVDGSRRLRSVSDFTGRLPLEVAVSYKLDGKSVKPGDIVGRSGKLEVQFTVENVTSQEQEVSYPDGKGGTVTKTVQVPVPIVGSLSTVAPSTFTHVTSEQANLAGDGEGGTKLSFTMTLFPPIGSTTATFGYTADITDGVVPQVEISALPVNPLESPTFKSAAGSYQGGADTGAQLTAGASEIDSNLLKLRDGAADLLAGLIKLHDGANQLSDGLNGDAAPGARKLAAGADKLADGLGQLDDGAGQLADGTGQLDSGARKLRAGAGQLAGGLGQAKSGAGDLKTGTARLASGQKSLADGLKKLHDGVAALPTEVQKQVNADPAYQALTGALAAVIQGIGSSGDTGQTTILGALNNIKWGLRNPQAASCPATPAACGVLDAVQAVRDGISAQLAAAGGLAGALTAARTSVGCATDPVCAGNLDAIIPTLTALPGQLKTARDTLDLAIAGGDNRIVPGIDLLKSKLSKGDPTKCAVDPSSCGAKQALQAALAGIPVLVSTLAQGISQTLLANIGTSGQVCDPQKLTLACGADALVSGTNQLDAGAGKLLGGMNQLSKGAGDLYKGTGDLTDGTGDLRAGAKKLANGADDASTGSGQLADGAGKLADGLGDAAAGSLQLTDGLGTAVDGAPQLVDGSQRLSTEGTKKLVAAGESTAQNYGEMVAVMDAGAKRAQTEDMAYGAPADAIGLTAYSYILKGDDGEGGRNLARGLGAVVILGAGAGVFALRRRFL